MKEHDRFRLHVTMDDDNRGVWVVVVAAVANVVVAVAKTAAALLTGSSSLRTEAVHSWIDVGNEAFVVMAARRAKRPADDEHPLGYGRASYVSAMFASVGTLAGGAVVGVWQGVRELSEPSAAGHYVVGYAVIAVSFLVEGISFVQTLREVRRDADALGRDVLEQAYVSSNAPMRAVFIEDSTALFGLVIAAVGLSLHELTGKAVYDAVGSILIGTMMGAAGFVLIARNGRFLAGQKLSAEHRTALVAAIRALPDVARLTFVYTEFIGPERYLVIAGVEVAGERDQAGLATVLREIEQTLMRRRYVGLAIMTLAKPDDDDLAE